MTFRARIDRLIDTRLFTNTILAVILFNAVLLGLETSSSAMQAAGPLIHALDMACLGIFVAELVLKLFARRLAFFRSGWNIFDFLIVSISLVPAAQGFSVLRALRILRLLRVISVAPTLRRVVEGFVRALPGMGSVFVLMGMLFYIGAVMATKLFGAAFPEWFGDLGNSAYTLFQVMTLESWSMGIVRPVMESHPLAWAFFVPFIVIATFTILNLFIGIIVSTMQELSVLPDQDEANRETHEILERIEQDLATLRKQMKK